MIPSKILSQQLKLKAEKTKTRIPKLTARVSLKRKVLLERLITAADTALKKRQSLKAQYDWPKHARCNQRPPEGEWRIWLILAGRGFGKTRTGAETIRQWVKENTYRRIALVAETLSEGRDVMIEGESGLLNISPLQERPIYEPTKRRLTWPNGTIATLFSAENYEHLRGPQFDAAWIDELAKFRHGQEAWDQLMLGLRLGNNPRAIVTTTPKPIPLIEQLVNREDVFVTRGTTYENKSNLAPAYLNQILRQYADTRLGSQEIYGEILKDTVGALWRRAYINYGTPPLEDEGVLAYPRIVIAIDPAITNTQTSDETGIVVAALGKDGKGYVLDDLSIKASPHAWAKRAVEAYWHHKADRIVAEVNKGGDLVERVIKSIDPRISYKAVRACRGKATRAEPISALYEQGKVLHTQPLIKLEQQMCSYVPGLTSKSPDRIDALVWALTELMLEEETQTLPRAWLV